MMIVPKHSLGRYEGKSRNTVTLQPVLCLRLSSLVFVSF